MKIIDLVTEGDSRGQTIEFIRIIDNKCKKYIQELGGWKNWLSKNKKTNGQFHLFRGMKADDEIGSKIVRNDRYPKDTPNFIHKFLDRWFNKKFGHWYRSNALFATGNMGEANVYGNELYIVFPRGNYETCWSPQYPDLWAELEDHFAEEDVDPDSTDSDEVLDHVLDVVQRARYVENADMDDIIDSRHEVMIKCDMYYYVKAGLYSDFAAIVSEMVEAGELR